MFYLYLTLKILKCIFKHPVYTNRSNSETERVSAFHVSNTSHLLLFMDYTGVCPMKSLA